MKKVTLHSMHLYKVTYTAEEKESGACCHKGVEGCCCKTGYKYEDMCADCRDGRRLGDVYSCCVCPPKGGK